MKTFKAIMCPESGGKSSRGRPRIRREDYVTRYLEIVVGEWRTTATYKRSWRFRRDNLYKIASLSLQYLICFPTLIHMQASDLYPNPGPYMGMPTITYNSLQNMHLLPVRHPELCQFTLLKFNYRATNIVLVLLDILLKRTTKPCFLHIQTVI